MSESSHKQNKMSRRRFLGTTALAAGGFMIVPRHVLGGTGYTAPSDRLNIAAIGCGGKGEVNIRLSSGVGYNPVSAAKNNIVALCDVDDKMGEGMFKLFPDARRFRDFRVMLEQMNKDIDAVIVSTPDHTHAVAAMAAMQLGKHVYCEKPLTHDPYEARMLTEAAKKYKVVTQMGNQGSSGEDIRRVQEWIQSGAIGEVREVHGWTNRPVWPQGLERPKETPATPASIDWDLWLGTAPKRPYHPTYHPFKWRGWWDFGTGAIGDMACHLLDPAFRALKLGSPLSVEASASVYFPRDWVSASREDGIPQASVIHYDFPAREGMPPVRLTWYDGGLMPTRPEELEPWEEFGREDGGLLFVGDKGKLLCNIFGTDPVLLPSTRMQSFVEPAKTLVRVTEKDHQTNWTEACKGNGQASSSFDYAGPFTEAIVLGCVAIRCLDIQEKVKTPDGKTVERLTGRKKLLWDPANIRFSNHDAANEFVKREYRKGWSLGV